MVFLKVSVNVPLMLACWGVIVTDRYKKYGC